MTLAEARSLRDEIRAIGLWSTVPASREYAPGRYFAQIWGVGGNQRFTTREQWDEYRLGMIEREKERQKILHRLLNPPRSPIEAMIDRACGLG